jgi:hypothetical protein
LRLKSIGTGKAGAGKLGSPLAPRPSLEISRQTSASGRGGVRARPWARRSFGHCRSKHKRRKGPRATPGSTAPGRKGSSRVSTFVSATRAMATQIDEVSGAFPWRWRIMVVGNAERDVSIGQNSKNVCRVPWDDGIQSCIGAAPEGVSGKHRAGLRRPRNPVAAETELDRPCDQESIVGHRGVAGC